MTPLRVRQLQPPHESDHFTLDEAIAAWQKVAADKRARAARTRGRTGANNTPRDRSLRPDRSGADPEP